MEFIEEQIKAYIDIKNQIEELEAKKNEIGETIKDYLKTAEGKKFDGQNYKAALVDKTLFKYTDEAAIVRYIKRYNLKNYLKETINTKVLNDDLKKGGSLEEDLKEYFVKTSSEQLNTGVK